jgi:predicted membrane protein
MYYYYRAVGYHAIFFYVIVVFISFLMLMRLYIAVFLCYFKAELHKKAKKELICENSGKNDMKSSKSSSSKHEKEKKKVE